MVTFVALALFVYLVGFIVLPFVIAGIIAYICTPLLDWLAGRTGLPRPLLAVLLFLLLVGLAGFTVAVAGRHLVAEAGSTVTDLQGTLDHLLHRAADGEPIRVFGRTIDLNGVARTIGDRIHGWFSRPDRLMLVAGFGFATLVGTFLTVVLLCYFLVSGKSVARGLFWLVPPSRRPLVAQIGRRLDPVLKRYFIGLFVIVIYAVIAAYIGLGAILGIDHAFLLALLTGILETIPIIGSTTAADHRRPGVAAYGDRAVEHFGLCALCGAAAAIDRSDRRAAGARQRRQCASGADHLLLSHRRGAARHSRRDPCRAGGFDGQGRAGDDLRR